MNDIRDNYIVNDPNHLTGFAFEGDDDTCIEDCVFVDARVRERPEFRGKPYHGDGSYQRPFETMREAVAIANPPSKPWWKFWK